MGKARFRWGAGWIVVLALGAPEAWAGEEEFLAALRSLPPEAMAGVSLEARGALLEEAADGARPRLDAAAGWLWWFTDGEGHGAEAMFMLKALPRPEREALIFAHVMRPFAGTGEPAAEQTMIFEPAEDGWKDVTEEILPEGIDRTAHFRPRREGGTIEVFEWTRRPRADGAGDYWSVGERTMNLLWTGEGFTVLRPEAETE